jgi:hypothetical protein
VLLRVDTFKNWRGKLEAQIPFAITALRILSNPSTSEGSSFSLTVMDGSATLF